MNYTYNLISTEALENLQSEMISGPWQVTMQRNLGNTSYSICMHSHAAIAVVPAEYWVDGYTPEVDEDGYFQPDDNIDCAKYRIATMRAISHLPDIIKEVLNLRHELKSALAYFDHHGVTGGSVETTRAAFANLDGANG